ncbi:MAG: carboxymuconolactone decarboxylase family protein [Candidatus Rokubacteria bacterium]|nr:carboxymuconolactone decarboxylase family protein [Candidatus Rokubacteria bacterium]
MDATLSEVHQELVAVGAAIAANCEPCLAYHVQKAREAGITNDQLQAAVAVAQQVKETPARLMIARANRLLGQGEDRPADTTSSRCCG